MVAENVKVSPSRLGKCRSVGFRLPYDQGLGKDLSA